MTKPHKIAILGASGYTGGRAGSHHRNPSVYADYGVKC